MIEIKGLVKKYGETTAVNGLDLDIPKGELFVLLGPNAAGKTTTIKILSGLLKPTQGTVKVQGYDVVADYAQVKKRMRYIPDVPYVYGKLTGLEFLQFICDLYQLETAAALARAEKMMRLFSIWDSRHQLTEDYSHGMRQKLVLTTGFLTQPPVMVIDEPMVGLDPASARVFKDFLRERTAEGGTILLSTHTLSLAEEVADRIGILHQGSLIANGTLQELRRQCGGEQELEKLFLTLTEQSGKAAE